MELAPLADLYPSSVKPDFAPLTSPDLSLEPGKFKLSQADLGVPVDASALLGEEERQQAAPAAAAAAPAAPGAGTAPKKPTKIKLVVSKKK